jgi:prepilin-type N-terminal cleavage/methylation domain-containing protein
MFFCLNKNIIIKDFIFYYNLLKLFHKGECMNIKISLKKGFSLFEMTIVIVIMGIMATAALPLLDTKKIKIRAAERFVNELYSVQDANRNYYMNEIDPLTGLHRFGDMNATIGAAYLKQIPTNPFSVTPITEGIVSNGQQYMMQFISPKQVTGVYTSLLPQSSFITNPSDSTTDIVSTYINIPGAEASRNNLLHRDSAVHQELRTLHGPLLINDNVDNSRSKLMVTNVNLDPSTLFNTNGNINHATAYQVTVGDIGIGRYGMKGLGISNDLNFEAANIDTAGNIRRGYIQLGIFESLGSQSGANGKIRTLTNENNFLVSSYKNAASPQWVTVIGDSPDQLHSGQLWTNPNNQLAVNARINSETGQIATRSSLAVKKLSNTDFDGASSWNTAYNDLTENTSDVLIASESNAGSSKGVITIADTNGATTKITKDANFYSLSAVGMMMHVGLYHNTDTLTGASTIGTPCANGKGIIKPIIMGTVSSNSNQGIQALNAHPYDNVEGYTIKLDSKPYLGFNSYIDATNIVRCQDYVGDAWQSDTTCTVSAGLICASNGS